MTSRKCNNEGCGGSFKGAGFNPHKAACDKRTPAERKEYRETHSNRWEGSSLRKPHPLSNQTLSESAKKTIAQVTNTGGGAGKTRRDQRVVLINGRPAVVTIDYTKPAIEEALRTSLPAFTLRDIR